MKFCCYIPMISRLPSLTSCVFEQLEAQIGGWLFCNVSPMLISCDLNKLTLSGQGNRPESQQNKGNRSCHLQEHLFKV